MNWLVVVNDSFCTRCSQSRPIIRSWLTGLWC